MIFVVVVVIITIEMQKMQTQALNKLRILSETLVDEMLSESIKRVFMWI